MENKKAFISGAIILMIAGLIVRMFGFVYRVYLSNLIGAEGMGLFQLISPVYSLIIMTLTSGISIAVSRLVAQETAKGHYVNLKRITLSGLMVIVFGGVTVSILIFFNLDFIVKYLLKDPRTYSSMLFLIPCIPVIAAASVLKGYFYGIQNVTPTAYSQIAEQVVKISLVLFVLKKFISSGLEYTCAAATAAIAIGEMSNLLVLCIMYRPSIKKFTAIKNNRGLIRKRRIMAQIFKIAVPVSTNRLITSLMSAIELIMIPARLLSGGMDYQNSMELYGKLAGMAMPIITFPAIVTSSLATTLVPAISEALALRNFRTINYRVSKSIQITFVLGFLFTAIFIAYPNEISTSIYKRDNVSELISLLSFTCLFFYLQQTLHGILNGLKKENKLLIHSVVGYVIRIAFVYFLIPIYGIKSYIAAMILSSVVVCILNLALVIKTTGLSIDVRNWIIKPGIVCIAMILASRYVYSFVTIFVSQKLFVSVLAVMCDFLVGCILMVIIGAINVMDILKLLGLKNSKFVIKLSKKLSNL